MSQHKIIHFGIIGALTLIIFGGGFYLFQSMPIPEQNELAATIIQEAEAQAIDGPESGFEIIASEKFVIDSRLWIQEEYPNISIQGGEQPFILEALGLPEGLKARLQEEGRSITFQGVPTPGKYDVSLALIDTDSNTTHTNIMMEIKPLLLDTPQKVMNEWAAWLADDVPTTYNLSELQTVTLLLNLVINE